MAGAVVFDLDGTLVDSAPDIGRALNIALRRQSLPPVTDDQVRQILGAGARTLVEAAIVLAGGTSAVADAVLADYTGEYRAAPAERTTVHADAHTALESLRAQGIRIGVCTNKRTGLARQVLAGTGLAGVVDAVVGIDSAPAGKPDPRHLTATLAELGVPAGDAVYVGDTGIDATTARRAGVRYRHVAWGHQVDGCVVIERFGELAAPTSSTSR